MKRRHYRQAIFVHISTLAKGNGECDPVCPLGNSLKSPIVSEYAVLHDHTSPFFAKLNYSLLYLCHEKAYQSFSSKVKAGVILMHYERPKYFHYQGTNHTFDLKSKVKH